MLRHLFIFLILFAGIATAGGGIYKWVDEHRISVYSEEPPSGKTAQQVKLPPQPPKEILERAHQEALRQEQMQLLVPMLPAYLPPAYPGGMEESKNNRRNFVSGIIKGVKKSYARICHSVFAKR